MERITPYDLLQTLKKVDVEEVITESLEESKEGFVSLQTEQLYSGKLNDGSPIEPEYAESTIKRKKAKRQPYDRVTTNNTGAYHKGMTVKRKGDELEIGSDVAYEKYIDQRYSKKLYGLIPATAEKYAYGPFWSVMKRKFEALTQLKFE